MSAKKETQESEGFTDEERAAMKERARELKAAARGKKGAADGESDVFAKIAEMPEPDRAMAMRIHEIIMARRASPRAENLVRDAGVCQGRQGCLLFPERAKVQSEVRDVRL